MDSETLKCGGVGWNQTHTQQIHKVILKHKTEVNQN